MLSQLEDAWGWVADRWQLTADLPWWVVVCLAAGVVVCCLVPPVWHRVRYAMTLVHEMGHVLVAWLVGRRVDGIEVHGDTSGLTVSAGRPRGLGVLVTFLAGYTAPPLVGVGMLWAWSSGWAGAALTWLCLLLASAVLLTRNLFGLLVAAAMTAVAGYVYWTGDAVGASAFVLAVGWFLTVAGLRAACGLCAVQVRGEAPVSDAALAAQHSLFPAMLWVVFFLVVSVAGVAAAARLLVTQLWGG